MFGSGILTAYFNSQQLGKSEHDDRDINAGLVASWRQDTEQQFRDVNDKLRPLPEEVKYAKLNPIPWFDLVLKGFESFCR